MAVGKNLLKTSLTEPKIQCLINPPLNNNLFYIGRGRSCNYIILAGGEAILTREVVKAEVKVDLPHLQQ